VCGPDGIRDKILKHCANSLAIPFSYILTVSYVTGILPRKWKVLKVANIVSVYKNYPKDNIENYYHETDWKNP
jgi:hypothetical protein